MVYFLLQRKTRKQYQQAFRVLREFNPLLEPTKIVIDIEKAAISAFKSELSTVSAKWGFFHFALANWQKIKELGLAVEYRKD